MLPKHLTCFKAKNKWSGDSLLLGNSAPPGRLTGSLPAGTCSAGPSCVLSGHRHALTPARLLGAAKRTPSKSPPLLRSRPQGPQCAHPEGLGVGGAGMFWKACLGLESSPRGHEDWVQRRN